MRKSCGGMTLIEVLVAFVVLSVTLAVIMQIFSGGLRNARMSGSYSRALFLAESKLDAVGVEQPLAPGTDGGQVGTDLRWRTEVSPSPDGADAERLLMPVRLYEVRVWVGWNEDGKNREIALSTLRLGPKP